MFIRIVGDSNNYSQDYDYAHENTVIWGELREYYADNRWHPYDGEPLGYLMSINDNNVNEFVKNVSGTYVGYYKTDLSYVFCSSSEAKRFYFFKCDNRWFFSDSVDELTENIGNNKIEIDAFEYEYYLINGYSTGFCTFLKGIYKVLPGEVIRCDESFSFNYDDRISHSNMLSSVCNKRSSFSDVDSFETLFHERLYNSLKNKDKIAVLFSGGADSSFLLTVIKDLFPQKDINPICFYSPQLPSSNILSDKINAQKLASKIGLELKNINPLDYETLEETMAINNRKMPFDSHISFWHGGSLRQIEDSYDCIVTGQNADTIYNFGPTGYFRLDRIMRLKIRQSGLAELFKRALFEDKHLQSLCEGKNTYHSLILSLLTRYYNISGFSKKNVTYPNFVKGFLSSEKYVPYLNTNTYKYLNNSDDYDKQLQAIVDYFMATEMPIKSQLVLLKSVSSIQGSDMRVLTELLSESKESKRVFFPFSSLAAIEAFGTYPLDRKDIFNSKQFIYSSLKKHGLNVLNEVGSYSNSMLTDDQIWHIINSYLYKIIPDSYCSCINAMKVLPNSINRDYLMEQFSCFTSDKPYNIVIIYRFLWSVSIINEIVIKK